MASVNGVEIRNKKTFPGSEAMMTCGDIYIDGNFAGKWSQPISDNAIKCSLSFSRRDLGELDKRILAFSDAVPSSCSFKRIAFYREFFFSLIMQLDQYSESISFTAQQFGFRTFAMIFNTEYPGMFVASDEHLSRKEFMEKHGKDLRKERENIHVKSFVEVFHDASFFDLVIDKKHPMPAWLEVI